VPTIFDRYTSQRAGARAIASWLNHSGHRTRAGRPWSHASVITVLRNRVYLGEIYYRGQHHPAPHPPLVDPATFQAAQRLLEERGEDRRVSASNASDYLLAGKLVCTHCGLHYVGTAAIGNRYRYRTCFSHQRYGKQACPSERLPADQLDQAILAGLLDTFARTDLAQQATRAIRRQASDARDRAEGELAAIRTEIDQAEAAIERYLGAFEAGTLPEAPCGKRVQTLGAKIAELQARELELQQALAASATQELATSPSWPASCARSSSTPPSPPRRPWRSCSFTRSTSAAATTSGRSSASPHARNLLQGSGRRFISWSDRCPWQDSNLQPAV
jgi:site-specific DNA recombinase